MTGTYRDQPRGWNGGGLSHAAGEPFIPATTREPLPRQPALHFQGPPFTVPSTTPSSTEGEPPACSHGSNNEALGIPQRGFVPEKRRSDFGKSVPWRHGSWLEWCGWLVYRILWAQDLVCRGVIGCAMPDYYNMDSEILLRFLYQANCHSHMLLHSLPPWHRVGLNLPYNWMIWRIC